MSSAGRLPNDTPLLLDGTRVEVRGRFEGRWVGGFEIASARHDRYEVRREMDGVVLPAEFAAADIRPRT